ncbi:MAG: bifunctional serine/threonine-protein kinase/formylglycine-generating enzyme family protein, partial [Candidatus Cloacimonetes bacterium]|nr:bifunctional serine/threonine-protein kinase/formylglycine-generating enzyme family protein [Candidatus Cloacimonadota bacterium]
IMNSDSKRTRIAKKTARKIGQAEITRERENADIVSEEFTNFPESGTIIDSRYEVLEKIGDGSYGSVYKAYDRKLDIFKALKFLKDQDTFSLFSEGRLLAKLNHPNILRIFDLCQLDELKFIDMEYFPSQNLEEYLQEEKLSETQILNIALNLTSALQYAENKKIMHCDLKPENILINLNGDIKLADFGASFRLISSRPAINSTNDQEKKSDSLTIEENQQGSTAYFSPERAKKGKVNIPGEIYSLGVTLYEIAFGEYPFTVDNEGYPKWEIPDKIIVSDNAVHQIIGKCLAINADDRYQNFKEVFQALKKIKEESPDYRETVRYRFINGLRKILVGGRRKTDWLIALILMISLLAISPFIVIEFLKYFYKSHQITIHGEKAGVYEDGTLIGETPLTIDGEIDNIYELRQGEETVFLYSNDEAKSAEITLLSGNAYVNNVLRGVTVTDTLVVYDSLSFMRLKLNINRENLQKVFHSYKTDERELHLVFDKISGDSLFMLLPEYVTSFTFRDTGYVGHSINLERFKSLKRIDISYSNINPDSISGAEGLESLIIRNHEIKSFRPFSRFPNLRVLDVSGTDIAYSDSLLSMAKIVNQKREKKSQTAIKTNRDQKRMEQTSNPQSRLTEQEKTYTLDDKNKQNPVILYIFIPLFALLVLGLYYLYKHRLSADSNLNEDQEDESPHNDDSLTYNRLEEKKIEIERLTRQIEFYLNENKIYSPPEENALALVEVLKHKYPDDYQTTILSKKIFKEIFKRIILHQKRKEYEPIHLISDSVLNQTSNKKIARIREKSKEKLIKNLTRSEFIEIKGGSFTMGDFRENSSSRSLKPHPVELSDFNISRTMVTNAQFAEFLNKNYISSQIAEIWIKLSSIYCRIDYKNGEYYAKELYADFPVYEVSHEAAINYCKWLGGRLPTEAEWEFAARNGGKNILYSCGNRISKRKVNYLVDKEDDLWHSVVPCKSYKPSKSGLYEMSGNLMEWCWDDYDKEFYLYSPRKNPVCKNDSGLKVIRGGAWCFPKEQAFTFYRAFAKENSRTNFIGFRIVRPV